MVGWLANGLVAYWIGRHAARPALYRFVGRQRFDRLERMVEAGGVTLLLGMRLVPVIPFSLFSMAAGAARADLFTFIWTTAVGYLPLTAVFVYLGSRLEELSPTDPVLWLGAAVLIALLVRHPSLPSAGGAPSPILSPSPTPDRWRPRSPRGSGSRSAPAGPRGPRRPPRARRAAELGGEHRVLADQLLGLGGVEVLRPELGVELGHRLGHLAQVLLVDRPLRVASMLRTKVSRYCHWRY